MSRFLYLAQPIDQAGPNQRILSWAAEARRRARDAGIGVYSPARAFEVPEGASVGSYIEKVNHAALSRCSGLLALLPAGVPTIGVPIEIERARQQEIPVAVITDIASWSLAGMRGVHLFAPEGIELAIQDLVAADYSMEDRKQPLPFKVDWEQGGKMPSRAYPDDAGLDLYVSESITIPCGQFRDVPCGVSVEMERWHWGLIIGRSSTLRKRGLLVAPGIIDPGYRGELFSGVQNVGERAQTLQVGDRVAQLILMSNQTQAVSPIEVQKLTESARGQQGFGSSGT